MVFAGSRTEDRSLHGYWSGKERSATPYVGNGWCTELEMNQTQKKPAGSDRETAGKVQPAPAEVRAGASAPITAVSGAASK